MVQPVETRKLRSCGTKSAVYYVFRCLLGLDVPNNSGCLAPIDVLAPEGSVFKYSACDPAMYEHVGKAVVFDSDDPRWCGDVPDASPAAPATIAPWSARLSIT